MFADSSVSSASTRLGWGVWRARTEGQTGSGAGSWPAGTAWVLACPQLPQHPGERQQGRGGLQSRGQQQEDLSMVFHPACWACWVPGLACAVPGTAGQSVTPWLLSEGLPSKHQLSFLWERAETPRGCGRVAWLPCCPSGQRRSLTTVPQGPGESQDPPQDGSQRALREGAWHIWVLRTPLRGGHRLFVPGLFLGFPGGDKVRASTTERASILLPTPHDPRPLIPTDPLQQCGFFSGVWARAWLARGLPQGLL